jgi:hypothetical protein
MQLIVQIVVNKQMYLRVLILNAFPIIFQAIYIHQKPVNSLIG